MNGWPTKEKDIQVAQLFMENYAMKRNIEAVGFLELVVNVAEKKMNVRIADWIPELANYFVSAYGVEQGDRIMRQVMTYCMVQGQTLH